MVEKTRVEVLRYLATAQNNHHKPKKKSKGALKRAEKVVGVEKAKAEGLPSGWIKEIRVRKRAETIRRDPYYTDPVSKNVFRSLKAVLQYLEHEELETFVQNSEGSGDKELEDNKILRTGVNSKKQLAINRARRHINFGQSSYMNEIEQEEQPSSSQLLAPSEHASEQYEIGTKLSNSDMQEAKMSEQKGEEGDSSKSTPVIVPSDNEVLPAKKSFEDGLVTPESAKTEPGSCKSKKKKVPELPRRASKRLAGLEVDPVPELKPRTRARRVAVKQSDNGVAGTDEGSSHGNSARGAVQEPSQLETKPGTECTAGTSIITELSPQSNKSKPFYNLAKSEKQIGKVETINNGDENQGCNVTSLESGNSPYEQQGNVKTDDKADTKLGVPLDLPLGELLTDPCIAFAIRTLTGINFDSSESSEVLPGSMSSEHSSANLATELFKVETDNKVDRKQGCSLVLPSGKVPIPEEVSESDTRADEKSGSPIDLPFGGSWQDPCIEFAIKTLTDDIPLDYDPNIQHYFQQQLSSGRTGGSDDTSLTSVGIDNFCQTESSCQQFHDVEKSGLTQQLEVKPAFPHSRTVSAQSSRRSVRNQNGNKRQ